MELHLDALQTTTLRDVLDNAWRDLRYEIADTDNSRFKAGLRDRERVITSILEQLPAEVPSPPAVTATAPPGVLTVNAGSSSIKAAVCEGPARTPAPGSG